MAKVSGPACFPIKIIGLFPFLPSKEKADWPERPSPPMRNGRQKNDDKKTR